MTRRARTNNENAVKTALRTLYANNFRNLTAEGYQEALSQMRRADPAKARRVGRALAPFLGNRIFRRRRLTWQETSDGTRARLALLPNNPHIQEDVRTVRIYLKIPDGHVHASEEDPLWREVSTVVKPESIRSVVEGNLTGEWLRVHREAVRGKAEPAILLSPELHQSATSSAQVRFDAPLAPQWLQSPPHGPSPYDPPASPIDWAVGSIIERHRLPWHVAVPLTLYTLTQNPDWISGIDPLQVEIDYDDVPSRDPRAFRVVIKELDEFVTSEDWSGIWKHYIKPRQERLWKERGMKPQGRCHTDIERLRDMLPLYQQMVHDRLTFEQALYLVTKDIDQETIRKGINDLKKLLVPLP